MLHKRCCEQFFVAIVVPVKAIESQKAKISGESTQMDVKYETGIAQRPWPQSAGVGQFETLEHRIDRDSLSPTHPVRERYRHTVNENQVDFSVRHAECLDAVLDRRRALERMREALLAPLAR